MTRALEAETDLLAALEDPDASRERAAMLTRALPPGPCTLGSRWAEVAADTAVEPWRRLVAYGVLVSRCVSYPAALEDFVRLALEPLGLSRDDTSDQTIVQNVPVERTPSDELLVAPLPIRTSLGQAALYVVVGDDGVVARAAVYPATD